MKVIFLSRRFAPEIGGVEKHVYEISKVLIKKGYEITVITESPGNFNEYEGIKIIRIPKTSEGWLKKFDIWKWIILNYKLFNGVHIIHAHDVYFWYLPLKLIFLSKKSFITFHGYESYPISKKAILIRKISEHLANGNIIVGDFIKKWYFTKPDYVIYGGTDIPKEVKKVKNKNSAVFIGRLDYHTGISGYVKAYEIVKKEIPNFKLEIVGDGLYRNKFKKYKLIGATISSDKYLEENSFAFVSRYLSILEALARKRLVFALYDNPVKEDYLRMAPYAKFIVIENSPEELARKVLYYLENPREAELLASKGHAWVKDKTWESVAEIYIKLWKKR